MCHKQGLKAPYTLTPGAKVELRRIIQDIGDDSPETAARLLEQFYAGLQDLAASLAIGHCVEELLPANIAFGISIPI